MAYGSTLAALFGYDPRLVARLSPDRQATLRRLAAAWLLSSALLALPLGYAAYTLEHSVLLATAVSVGALVVFVNMVRLTVAGGGLGPHAREADLARYRPGLAPLGMLAVLSVLLAQPAQLPFWKTALDAPVAAERAALLAQHAEVYAGGESAGPDLYARQLARCDFLVLRLHRLWDDPQRALPLAVVYVLIVLLPALWSRFLALEPLRDYERLRLGERRRAARRSRAQAEVRMRAHLSAYPTYVAPASDRGARWLRGRAL